MAKKPVIVPKGSNTEELPIADVNAPAPVLLRRKTEDGGQRSEDGGRKPAAETHGQDARATTELPTMLEFVPVNDPATWRVEKCDLLATEFGLGDCVTAIGAKPAALDLVKLRAAVSEFVFFCQTHPRLWLLARRIYGIAPLFPDADAQPGDLRVWSRAEMDEEGYSVKADLEALRGFWVNHCKREGGGGQRSEDGGRRTEGTLREVHATEPRLGTSPQSSPGRTSAWNPAGEGGDNLLDELDFPERMFTITVYDPLARMTADGKGGVVARPEKENRKERAWFIGRVTEWEKMLRDSIGGAVARSALMNELHLRRLEAEIAVAEPKSRGALYDQQSDLTTGYQTSIDELQRMFPELAVAGKVSFKATFSDVIRSHLDYYGNGDRRLVDKVHTVMEMEYLLRTSQQVEARYRFGLNLAIIDNISGMTDPNFRPRFKHRTLKLADAGFRAGVDAARSSMREKVVDLENGVLPGEGDDFEDFNDAECPHCGGRISSQATRCPECRKPIYREPVIPPASPIPPASVKVERDLDCPPYIPPASPIPPSSIPDFPDVHGHYVPHESPDGARPTDGKTPIRSSNYE